MKKFAFLLVAIALVACSESENIADADDVLAQEESSSSVDKQSSATEKTSATSSPGKSSAVESKGLSSSVVQDGKSSVVAQSSAAKKNPKSSSSGKAVLSSGNEKQVPSNSKYLDFLDEEIGDSFGCGGAGGAGAAGGAAGGVTGMGIGFSVDSSSLAIFPYTQIIKARTAKLVSNGVQ